MLSYLACSSWKAEDPSPETPGSAVAAAAVAPSPDDDSYPSSSMILNLALYYSSF
jgi:hypothetical protein